MDVFLSSAVVLNFRFENEIVWRVSNYVLTYTLYYVSAWDLVLVSTNAIARLLFSPLIIQLFLYALICNFNFDERSFSMASLKMRDYRRLGIISSPSFLDYL